MCLFGQDSEKYQEKYQLWGREMLVYSIVEHTALWISQGKWQVIFHWEGDEAIKVN